MHFFVAENELSLMGPSESSDGSCLKPVKLRVCSAFYSIDSGAGKKTFRAEKILNFPEFYGYVSFNVFGNHFLKLF